MGSACTSMNRLPACRLSAFGVDPFVVLHAQAPEQLHDASLCRVVKSAARHVLGRVQQGFGFRFHAASVGGSACNRTQCLLQRIEQQ